MFKRPMRLLSGLVLGLAIAGCSLGPFAAGEGVESRLAAQSSRATYQLFVEPDEGQAPVLTAIQKAKASVDVVVYMLSSPEIIQALCEAHGRGVKVRVLLEQRPFNPSNPNVPLPINKKTFETLEAAGVPVRYADRRFVYTHQKTMIVDQKAAYILTANLSRAAFEKNREYGLINRSESDVAEIQAMFEADWEHKAFTPMDPDLVVSPDNSRSRLVSFIRSAKRSVMVQDEVMGDQEVADALGERVRAGVDVKVQAAKFEPNALGDTNAKLLKQLNDVGVSQVRFQVKPMLHAKLIVVDGEAAYVGSINLTTNSLNNNRELGVIVRERAIVNRLVTFSSADWKAAM
ncbi:hypothetical protein J7643_18080 [bacterium]|nr:hypothetical protein [bacterium]